MWKKTEIVDSALNPAKHFRLEGSEELRISVEQDNKKFATLVPGRATEELANRNHLDIFKEVSQIL